MKKFALGRSVFFIVGFVFMFGLFLEIVRSNFSLTYGYNHDHQNGEQEVNKANLPHESRLQSQQPKYLVLYDEQEEFSLEVKDNIIATLDYMKKETEEVSVNKLPISFDSYLSVIVTFESLDQLKNLSSLNSYVENGGSLFLAVRPAIEDNLYLLYRKLGIYELGNFVTTKGVFLTSNVLIGKEGAHIKGDSITNSSISLGLDRESKVYAKSSEGIPLLWDRSYGKGKFVVFNGTMLNAKTSRGLISGAISYLHDDFLYPIMNMKIAFLDSFPAPVPKGSNKELFEEFRRDIPSFYREVWWPTIQKEAVKYNIKYTSGLLETNNEMVSPPFEEHVEHVRQDFIKYGRELLKIGGEIGIKGYNNKPLILEDGSWKSVADMTASLTEVDRFLNSKFPSYSFKTYFPPNLFVSEYGLDALNQGIPTVQNTLANYYSNDEFTVSGRYVTLPIITSGYQYSAENEWAIANGINSIGVFSHQISPWDVLNVYETTNSGWEDLSSSYENMLRDVSEHYPWLKEMTASEAGQVTENYKQTNVYIEKNTGGLTVYLTKFVNGFSFILRTDKKIRVIENGSYEKIDKNVYFIEAKDLTLKIRLEG